MTDLISLVPLDYPSVQIQAAEAVVLARELEGRITPDEAVFLLKSITDKVQRVSGAVSSHPNFIMYSEISSSIWNDFIDALLIDLRTLYDVTMNAEAINKQMEVIANADFTETKASILKVINQLRVYQFLKDNPQYQDLKVIDFIRSINLSDKAPSASVDKDIRMLELPMSIRQMVSLSKYDNRRTVATVSFLGGGVLAGFGDYFAPAKMLDPNPKNYWVDIMSSKSPLQFTYNTSWGSYDAQGAVAEIVIDLSHSERVNNLKILPFSDFPYNIVDVSFKETSTAINWTSVPQFSIQRAVEDWVEFDFPYITVRSLKIAIEQPNYTKNISILPESLIRRNQLWSQIKAEEFKRDIHSIELTSKEEGTVKVEPEQLGKIAMMDTLSQEASDIQFSGERRTEYQDFTKLSESVNSVIDKIAPGAGNEMRELISGEKKSDEDSIRQITSFEYMIGVKALQLSNITYHPQAYYESGEFITSGTVTKISLDTEERHPLFYEDDGQISYRRTSIEYEIETAPDQRFPIVPITDVDGENYIVNDEKLNVKLGQAKLRFAPIANSMSLRENGKRLSSSRWTLNDQTVTITDHKKNAIYTATYYVPESATIVDIDSTLDSVKLTDPEEFQDTDSDNKVTLKYYPYSIYEIIRADQFWVKKEDEARWEWFPDFAPLSHGTVTVSGTVVTLTKDDASDPGFNDIPFTSFAGTTDLKIYLQETGETLTMSSSAPSSDTIAALASSYSGNLSGSTKFILGRTQTIDNRVFGLNISFYEPIEVYIDDIKAVNRTDYYARENPVFINSNSVDKKFEYIHSGKNLLFNGPIKGRKIRVYYSWLTQYLKLLATLRCNVPVASIFTPKIDTAKIRIKSTEL